MRLLRSLSEVAGTYDAIVLDQWGVLHDGSAPYPGSVEALTELKRSGGRLAVLSNSGKRAASNQQRIAQIGFPAALWDVVMTSGEALWTDLNQGRLTAKRLFPIERSPGDAEAWSDGLKVELTSSLDQAEALLLMGLPDGTTIDAWSDTLQTAQASGLACYCSNPDIASPRAGGVKVISPGALAVAYQRLGGTVHFYGKPHRPVFSAIAAALGTENLLMVGDSLIHDITGSASAGWDSLFIQGGLYAERFQQASPDQHAPLIEELARTADSPLPTFRMDTLA